MSDNSRGTHRWDKERQSLVLVLQTDETPANEYNTGQYNWDKTELTVADYEANKAYPEDDPVVTAVYLESLSEFVDDPASVTPDEAEELLEQERTIRSYTFPVSRLADPDNVEQATR